MKKILDFIIIFLLVFLIIQIIPEWEKKQVITNSISIIAEKSTYSIPGSVKLNLKNSTDKEIKFNTCKDIIVRSNLLWVIDFTKTDFCKDISLKSGETKLLDYSKYYKKFENAWEYRFDAKIEWKEPFSQIELENRGTISKIFIAFIYEPIINLFYWLIDLMNHSLGWWIILLTIIIKALLIIPQHKSMLSQKKLQAVQPKIKEVQEKYKGNQQKMWMELMALYKKEWVNPMWSCGFLLIQMPILFVLYNVILEIRDPSNAYYLYSFLENFDITKISSDFLWMELFKTGMELPFQWALLALSVWMFQYFQVKLSLADKLKETKKWAIIEKKKWSDAFSSMMPDPEMMNKFMLYWMPAMITVVTFTFFAGLGIYWWISTLFMIAQQLIVNKVIKKK